MDDIDLTMLARSAYKAILRSLEAESASDTQPQQGRDPVKEVGPMIAKK